MTTKEAPKLRIEIGDRTLSEEESARLGRALARELRQLDAVEEVRPATLNVPEGARPAEALTWGALILAIAPVALDQLIDFLRNWSKRSGGQRTKISVQVADRRIEGEYDPACMTPEQIEDIAKRLRRVIAD
jgi:hypothetical protein